MHPSRVWDGLSPSWSSRSATRRQGHESGQGLFPTPATRSGTSSSPDRPPVRARVRPRDRAPRAGARHTAWWKEERREKVFIDYNRTPGPDDEPPAYSVRPRPDATVSTPVTWEELPDVVTEDFTLVTMPKRFASLGDVQAGIDDAVCDLGVLFEWVEREEAAPCEAPYRPNFPSRRGRASSRRAKRRARRPTCAALRPRRRRVTMESR